MFFFLFTRDTRFCTYGVMWTVCVFSKSKHLRLLSLSVTHRIKDIHAEMKRNITEPQSSLLERKQSCKPVKRLALTTYKSCPRILLLVLLAEQAVSETVLGNEE